jgi:glycosyltransferase involved in cell wall biosynthesis
MTSDTHITVGVPVYHSWDIVAETLNSVQHQTFRDFTVVISVDGGDERSANACRPFLTDSRFVLHVQTQQHGWAGNINWLLARMQGAFFCYMQHDDRIDPGYLEALVAAATMHPHAAICYSDLAWIGNRGGVEAQPSMTGTPLDRAMAHIDQLPWIPFRGLVRASAARAAGLLRIDEHDSYAEDVVWLTRVARSGEFVRVPQTLYFKRDHGENRHRKWFQWEYGPRRAAWLAFCVALLDAALPSASNDAERLELARLVFNRLVGRKKEPMLFRPRTQTEYEQIIDDFFVKAEAEQVCRMRRDPATNRRIVTFPFSR